MAANVISTKRLICTTSCRTLYEVVRAASQMDVTAKKLVDTLADIRRQIAALQQQANSISTALETAGYRSTDLDRTLSDPRDKDYAERQPFRNRSLVHTCKQILNENAGMAFTKSELEYLATIGGYPFSTDDSINSIDVTMRRLAKQGFCEIARPEGRKGRAGNIYMLPMEKAFEWVKDVREAAIERGEIKVPPPPKKAANSKTR